MNRKELLARAAEENIPLTESKLRRYINLGLIVSEVKGKGRARGTSAYYTERTIDTLKEIQRLVHIKQETLIFTLYWKGYPVAWDKLKDALRSFVSTMEITFVNAVEAVSDPDDAEYAAQEIAKNALPSKRPGRPSKESEAALEQIYRRELKFTEGMLSFVLDLGTHRMLTVDNMLSFFDINEVAAPDFPEALLCELTKWTSLDRMFASIHHTEEKDFIDMTELIVTLRWYWNEFEKALDDPTAKAYFTQLFELVDKHFPGGFIAENTALIQYIMLVLLVLKQQFPVKEVLQSEQAKEMFRLMCQQLSNVHQIILKGGDCK